MYKLRLTAFLLCALSFTHLAVAYKQSTHVELTERAFLYSDVVISPMVCPYPGCNLLEFIGLSQGFATTLLSYGADDENDGERALNHFYDPVNEAPLNLGIISLGQTSPDWIIAGKKQPIDSVYSYELALSYYYKAITLPSAAERQAYAGKTFVVLEHIVHHIQDMGQPEHTRNDEHCDDQICQTPDDIIAKLTGVKGLVYRPSDYELYADQIRNVIGNLTPDPVYAQANPDPSFASARDFWRASNSVDGLTLASNGLFVTRFRNYVACSSAPEAICASRFYDFPSVADARLVDVIIGSGALSHQIEYPIGSNRLISTYGRSTTGNLAFSLTSLNYAAAVDFLFPKVLNYTSGILNFFFRGRITAIRKSKCPRVTVAISNLGPTLPAGVFEAYYNNIDGSRTKANWSYVTTGLKSGETIETSLSAPDGQIVFYLTFRPSSFCESGNNCPSNLGSSLVAWGKGNVFKCRG